MFPLQMETIYWLALLAGGGFVAVVSARLTRLLSWGTALLFGLGLAWPWSLALAYGLNTYTYTIAFIASAWTLGALTAGALWGRIVRRFATGAVMLIAALTPTLATSAYLLERQRVPTAPCAERAVFKLDDVTLTLPRDAEVRSRVVSDAPDQAWQGHYGRWLGAKPDVKDLCSATDGGRDPLPVAHLCLQ